MSPSLFLGLAHILYLHINHFPRQGCLWVLFRFDDLHNAFHLIFQKTCKERTLDMQGHFWVIPLHVSNRTRLAWLYQTIVFQIWPCSKKHTQKTQSSSSTAEPWKASGTSCKKAKDTDFMALNPSTVWSCGLLPTPWPRQPWALAQMGGGALSRLGLWTRHAASSGLLLCSSNGKCCPCHGGCWCRGGQQSSKDTSP